MKKYAILTLIVSLFALITYAQNDTLFILKNGEVVGQYNTSEIDSIIFYNPQTGSNLPTSVSPLLTNNWKLYAWPYNAYYPDYSGSSNVNGKFAAACGPTALSRVLGFWKEQITYTGIIDAMNTWNDVLFQCNLDTLDIDFNNLPAQLNEDDPENIYNDVAEIFLAAGAVGLTNAMDAGTPSTDFIDAIKIHFNLDNNVRFERRWDYTKEEWINLLKTELAAGHPLMIAARTEASPAPWEGGNVAGHWFNIDGYNNNDEFHINYNFSHGNFEGYYDVDDFGDFNSYGMVVVGFKPAQEL